MDFTTPWKPSINGNEVPPCRLYEDVVEEGARPSSQRDPGWTLKTLEPIFVRAPKAKFALWECALAIWRLRLSEEEGGKEVVWQEHVQAWLERHRDICHHFRIKPLQVLVEFGEGMVTAGYMSAEKIPSLDEIYLVQAPASSPIPVPVGPPTKKSRVRSHPKQPLGDILVGKALGSDRKSARSSLPETTRSRLPSKDQGQPVGSKRGSQDSPTSSNAPTKRPRVTRTTAPGPDEDSRIDLDGVEFLEDSVIDPTVVPKARGKVCDYCVQRSSPCQPIWHLNKGTVTVRCRKCLVSRRGCSFRDVDFGIATWPTLIKTATGIERRAKEAAKKLPVTKKILGPPPTPISQSTPEGSALDAPDTIVDPQTAEDSQATRPSVEAPVQIPVSNVTISYDAWNRMVGREERFFFENLASFEAALSDPRRSSTTLGSALAEVRATIVREEGTLATLATLVKERKRVMQKLIARLNAEAERIALAECRAVEAAIRESGSVDGEEE